MKVTRLKKVSSTNDIAKDYPIGSVIIAEVQTKGHGRFRRGWSSSKGGIYISLVLPMIDKPQFYTFIGCISALKAIRDVTGTKAIIKWPNDLYLKSKKVCGILTINEEDKSIVGIGINVNNALPGHLRSKAATLNFSSRSDKELIIQSLLKHFKSYLKSIDEKQILADWKINSFLGSKVEAKTLNNTIQGIAHDLDADGFLIIKTGNKKIRVIEGDVSVKLKR